MPAAEIHNALLKKMTITLRKAIFIIDSFSIVNDNLHDLFLCEPLNLLLLCSAVCIYLSMVFV